MKRFFLITISVLSIGMWMAGDVSGRGGSGGGGRGGGGGGGARGGGGGGRPGGGGGAGAGRTPSMSRPSTSRPSGGGGGGRPGGGSYAGARPGGSARPGGGGSGQINRPQGNRPALGNLPTPSRPGTGISPRPGGGGSSRPSVAGGGGTRPGGGRPSQGQLNDFLDLGGSSSRPSFNRPATFPGGAGGQVAGNAAYDFLNNGPGAAGRPSSLPARPGGGTTRPGTGDLAGGDRPGRPGNNGGAVTLPGQIGGGNRPGRPGGGEGNRPGRPGDINNRPGQPGDRPGDGNHRPDRNPNWNQSQNWRHNQWSNVNNHWNNNWNHYDRWFQGNWWNHNPNCHFNNNFNYWGWATWPAVASWFPWGYSQPTYYNYGSNVYYQDDMVYYGTTAVASAADYANQAEQIATSIPATPPPADSWMPLGVFALMPDGEAEGADPTMFLQLAVSKEGVIAGTLQNTVSGTTKSVEGMVDKETQRAAWTEVGKTRPIMETGIGNLTQDTASVLVHYADDTTQQWLLVRMDKPPAGTSGANSAAGATTGAGATPPQ